MPQQIFIADETIAQNIALGISSEKIDMGSVEQAAKMADLHEFIINELPEGYFTEVGERGLDYLAVSVNASELLVRFIIHHSY